MLTGGTQYGPHKSDFVCSTNQGMQGNQLSTGQQKTIVLLLILAQCNYMVNELNKKPIILMDEVCSHLDNNNRSLLLKQPRDSRNILALGKFSRKMDEITVDMQFIDIANWDELDKREIIGSYNNVPQLNNQLSDSVEALNFISDAAKEADSEVAERKKPKRKYQLPSSDLLDDPVNISDNLSRDELVERANYLTQSMATFGVEGKVVNVHPGPIITLFEVEPAEGVRVNKFVQLSSGLHSIKNEFYIGFPFFQKLRCY